MRLKSLQLSNIWRMGLIALAIMASLIAGVSPIAGYSPLIAGGIVIAVIVGALLLQKPTWALYAAIFVILLPSARGESSLAHTLDRLQSLLNRSVTLIALISWMLNATTRRRRIVWTRTALLMLGFLSWGMITLSWAPDLGRGVEQLGQYAFRWLLFLVLIANIVDTKETLDGLMRILVANGWILILAGVGAVLFQEYEPGTRLRVLGMNENEFGVSLLVTMPGVLWQVMQAPERQKTLRMLLSVVFLLLALVLSALSGSLGSVFSLLITLFAFWFWKATRRWGKLGLLILAVIVISAPFAYSTLVDRFSAAEEQSVGGRLLIWQASWLTVHDHPWSGIGIGNAGHILSSYLNRITSYFNYREAMVSHNPILQIWIETGTPGILLYVSVLVSALWLFVLQWRRPSEASAGYFASYRPLILCVFAGVMLSWIKGGGMESHPHYFLILALLLIPSHVGVAEVDCRTKDFAQETR